MVDIASLESVLDKGHAETDLVGMPVSLVRAIVGELRRADAAVAQLRRQGAMIGVLVEIAS